jgi:nucleoside-diphosphate-sugar epimerase
VRIVVTGASGNVGTGLLRRLAAAPEHRVVGVCRRPPPPEPPYDRAEWVAADITATGAVATLTAAFRGADAVVHLAWALQPARDERLLERINLGGTRAVLDAARAAGVGHVVFASSIGVYAPGPGGEPVDEQWPRTGIAGSVYSAQKVAAETMLDRFDAAHDDIAVTRIRPALVAQRGAAREFRRYFLGYLLPRPILRAARRGAFPLVPLPTGLWIQLVHADDLTDAFVRVLEQRATGAFDIAADALDTAGLARVVGARAILVPRALAGRVVTVLDTLRLTRITPGWFDMMLLKPVVRTRRAQDELGWTWGHSTSDTAREVLDGLVGDAADDSPVLRQRPRARLFSR